MKDLTEAVVSIALAIVGLAIIATLVSKKSNTTGVIQAGASGFNNALGVATASITGTSVPLSLGYPSSSDLGMGFGG